MKMIASACVVLVAVGVSASANPVSKAVEMLGEIHAQVSNDRDHKDELYKKTDEMLSDEIRSMDQSIQTWEAQAANLRAAIGQASSQQASASTKIEELAASIAADDSQLKEATEIRAKETEDFAAQDAELASTIDMLKRAIGLLEREASKHPAFLQGQNFASLTQAFTALVQASVLSSADASTLTSLVQQQQQSAAAEDSEDADALLGAPAAAAYKGHSGDIISTLEDLLQKAEGELDSARKAEQSSKHNFALLKQSLDDNLKFSNDDMAENKAKSAEAAETQAGAEGELSRVEADIAATKPALAESRQTQQMTREEKDAAMKSFAEELAAIEKATQVLQEMTGGASASTYGLSQMSLLQLSSSDDLVGFEVVRLLKDLSRKEHSTALTQVASQVSSVMRSGATAGNFGKVKKLISELIAKLEQEGQEAATEESYCQEEAAKSNKDKAEKTATVEKLSTKLDQAQSASARLAEELQSLQATLATQAKQQADANKLRQEENTFYVKNKADLAQGIKGVQMAISTLKEYYGSGDSTMGHSKKTDGSTGVIGMLEVVEADFERNLAEIDQEERSAQESYDKLKQEATMDAQAMQQDVKYKTREKAGLDKTASELGSDRDGVQAELDAVQEYLDKLSKRCTVKAETYGEKKARRDAEMAGLKEALAILENQGAAALLQSTRSLRGIRAHLK